MIKEIQVILNKGSYSIDFDTYIKIKKTDSATLRAKYLEIKKQANNQSMLRLIEKELKLREIRSKINE